LDFWPIEQPTHIEDICFSTGQLNELVNWGFEKKFHLKTRYLCSFMLRSIMAKNIQIGINLPSFPIFFKTIDCIKLTLVTLFITK